MIDLIVVMGPSSWRTNAGDTWKMSPSLRDIREEMATLSIRLWHICTWCLRLHLPHFVVGEPEDSHATESPVSRKAALWCRKLHVSGIPVTHSLIPPLPPSSWLHTRVWMSGLSPQPQRICQAWLRRAESPCASLRHWLGSLHPQKRGFPYSFLVCSDFLSLWVSLGKLHVSRN